MSRILYFAIGWGAATLFWGALWFATEWADNDFLECFFLGLNVFSGWAQIPLKPRGEHGGRLGIGSCIEGRGEK